MHSKQRAYGLPPCVSVSPVPEQSMLYPWRTKARVSCAFFCLVACFIPFLRVWLSVIECWAGDLGTSGDDLEMSCGAFQPVGRSRPSKATSQVAFRAGSSDNRTNGADGASGASGGLNSLAWRFPLPAASAGQTPFHQILTATRLGGRMIPQRHG